MEQAIESGTPSIRVAELDGQLIGWVSFGPSRDQDAPIGTAELMAIYIDPTFWACGIGTALWAEARQALRAMAINRSTCGCQSCRRLAAMGCTGSACAGPRPPASPACCTSARRSPCSEPGRCTMSRCPGRWQRGWRYRRSASAWWYAPRPGKPAAMSASPTTLPHAEVPARLTAMNVARAVS